MEKELIIKDLCIGYISKGSRVEVYRHLSARFTQGMFVGIIGKNGLGKSTLLRTMAGLQQKLNGEVLYDHTKFELIERSELAKFVAVVLTEKVAGFNITVNDLVSSGRVPYTNAYHQLTNEDLAVIRQCIELCGLSEHVNKPLNELSDGLFQKAMIAKGLAQQTSFLLLDEPTAFLDFPSKHQLFELLKEITHKEHKCIITSSHDIELVLKYCSHLLILADNNQFEFIEVSNYKASNLFKEVTNSYFD